MPLSPRPSAGPPWRGLLVLVACVLLVHGLLLLGMSAPLEVRLSAPQQAAPVQLRVVQPPAPARAPRPVARVPAARPVAATVPEPAETVVPVPEPAASEAEAAPPVAIVPPHEPAAEQASAPQTATAPVTSAAWPLISLGALPPSRLLSYQLSGMDKGLNYHASGELRWQHNDTAYELTLSVRAFLLGSRHWRSVGQIDATGLAPRRFSDSWRNERAAHFDREQQRIVFSSNSKPAPLEAGAQDQVSLYVQLAAAMAGEPERFVPGTRLQVQTATVRDAQPWAMVMEGAEALTVGGQTLSVVKWVCQPRNQYEAKVEFWVSARQDWLPVRIRITQASGSWIDLLWRGSEPLPPLPVGAETTGNAKAS